MEQNTGYEDIDNLVNNQNNMLDESLKQQQDIVNKKTQMQIDALEKNKGEIDQQTDKMNKGLYAEYKKAQNPYGANAEELYARGLGNSGYAETTQTNLYNTYQKNITDTMNNAQKLKADFDFQMNQARQTGDITLAQNALEIYKQKMQLATQEYELRNNREQYLYQKEQDALAQDNWLKEFERQQNRDQVADNQWQQSFDYNKNRDDIADSQWREQFDYNKNRDNIADSQWQQGFDYQKQRDQVSDSQWAKEYALSKKKSSSGSSGYKLPTTGTIDSSKTEPKEARSIEEVLNSVKTLQGPNISKPIYSTIGEERDRNGKVTKSGKYFSSVDELLNYYGYIGVDD